MDETKKGVVWKDINVENRNRKRLGSVQREFRLRLMFIELVKNGLEYSLDHKLKIKVKDNEEEKPYILFENKFDDEGFDLDRLKKALTTYNNVRSTNFNEGLSLLAYTLFRIEAGTAILENESSDDGFYQYVKYESNSRKPNSKWRCYLYGSDAFPFEELKSELDKTIPLFIITGRDRLIYNGKIIHQKSLQELKRPYSSYTYSFKLPPLLNNLRYVGKKSLSDKIRILWKLGGETDSYQEVLLRSKIFDGKGVQGDIVIEDISCFANENRIELADFVIEEINEMIQDLIEISEKLSRIDNYYRNYSFHKEHLILFLNLMTNIPKKKIRETFFPTGSNKSKDAQLEKLFDIASFIYTIAYLSKKSSEFLRKYNEKYEEETGISEIELPYPKNETIVKSMSSYDFRDYKKELGLTLSKTFDVFKDLPIGIVVKSGTPSDYVSLSEYEEKPFVFFGAKRGFYSVYKIDDVIKVSEEHDLNIIYSENDTNTMECLLDDPINIVNTAQFKRKLKEYEEQQQMAQDEINKVFGTFLTSIGDQEMLEAFKSNQSLHSFILPSSVVSSVVGSEEPRGEGIFGHFSESSGSGSGSNKGGGNNANVPFLMSKIGETKEANVFGRVGALSEEERVMFYGEGGEDDDYEDEYENEVQFGHIEKSEQHSSHYSASEPEPEPEPEPKPEPKSIPFLGQKYILSYVSVPIKKGSEITREIPFMFSEKQYKDYIEKDKMKKSLYFKNYKALLMATKFVIEAIKKAILDYKGEGTSPLINDSLLKSGVLPFFSDEPYANYIARYSNKLHTLMYNHANWVNRLKTDKNQKAQYLIDVICHELTHAYVKKHNESFLIMQNHIKEAVLQYKAEFEGRKQYVYKIISKLL